MFEGTHTLTVRPKTFIDEASRPLGFGALITPAKSETACAA